MEILILLIPMSVVIALLIGAAFWWSAESGQFDDLDNPGQRILLDDDAPIAVAGDMKNVGDTHPKPSTHRI
jgi:cbb3-type cytochrome oxidase maturation protein